MIMYLIGICSNSVRLRFESNTTFGLHGITSVFSLGGSRGSHCEENTGRSGARYGSHAAGATGGPAGDAAAAPQQQQQRGRRTHDAPAPIPLDDVITSSK